MAQSRGERLWISANPSTSECASQAHQPLVRHATGVGKPSTGGFVITGDPVTVG